MGGKGGESRPGVEDPGWTLKERLDKEKEED